MPTDPPPAQPSPPHAGTGERKRPLTPAAERALAEAAARRAKDLAATGTPEEVGGRGGLDPTRYGDWEINGLATDF